MALHKFRFGSVKGFVSCIFAKFAEAGKKRSKAVHLLEKRVINVGGLQKKSTTQLGCENIFEGSHTVRERERERESTGGDALTYTPKIPRRLTLDILATALWTVLAASVFPRGQDAPYRFQFLFLSEFHG
jgi:hypothetical protein